MVSPKKCQLTLSFHFFHPVFFCFRIFFLVAALRPIPEVSEAMPILLVLTLADAEV